MQIVQHEQARHEVVADEAAEHLRVPGLGDDLHDAFETRAVQLDEDADELLGLGTRRGVGQRAEFGDQRLDATPGGLNIMGWRHLPGPLSRP